ncbi:hypothetical protein F2Q68_00025413 [Brassica cretica]|uniref:Uncharacterized protein n=1 Tax=Brassica cretica TaxID=69181 RepID=A0A8S9IJ54_BRACR|nr:hypothetical protein F2Q68_00025413 [Brassica cretica]
MCGELSFGLAMVRYAISRLWDLSICVESMLQSSAISSRVGARGRREIGCVCVRVVVSMTAFLSPDQFQTCGFVRSGTDSPVVPAGGDLGKLTSIVLGSVEPDGV